MFWLWTLAILAGVGVASDLFFTSMTFFGIRFNLAALGVLIVGQLFYLLYFMEKQLKALKIDDLRNSLEELKSSLDEATRRIEELESNAEIDPVDC